MLGRRIVLSFLAAAALGMAASPASVWPVDSLVKVFPDDAPGANQASQAVWPVARNGHTSLQFAVRASAPVLAFDVTVSVGGGLHAEIRRAGFVPVRANPPKSPAEELARTAPSRFPDPLVSAFPFTLAANETLPVWITIYAPPKTAPRVYSGKAVFRSAGKRIASLPFRIRVARASVPEKQALKVTNWMNLDQEFLGRYFDLSDSGRYWDLLANFARVLADHKQNTIITPVLALTDAKVVNGTVAYDFSRLDRFVGIFTKAGAADVIEGGHLIDRVHGYNSPLSIPAFVVENGEVQRKALAADDPRAEPHAASFLTALYAHLKEKGWLDRYVQHVLDEAHGSEPPVYLRYVGLVRKAMPGVKTIDAIDQTASLLGDACDIWVPQLGKFDDGMNSIREHVKKGGQAWYYTCLFPQGPYLNRFIQQPLLKTRLLHWFNYRYDFTGFLHWGGNYWSADPYGNTEPPLEDGTALPAGDAFITYPSRQEATILASIRLEAMREGIEDYELLHALAVKNPAKASELAAKAITGMSGYERDVAAFRRLQAELLNAF